MNKILLGTALLLAASPALARTLTPEEAMARATTDTPAKMRPFCNASPVLTLTGKYGDLTTYYIYSTGASALILGAYDLSRPVLAYLDTPVTADTQLPPQMTWWLEQYGKQIEYAEQHRDEITFADAPCREAEGRSAIEPMLQTAWNQAAPFNDLLPDGVVTGCVATAMAQVMKYHNYPERGKGTVSTQYGGSTLSMNLDETVFDWDNMLNNYPSDNLGTAEQRNAVATLMKACGYSVKMDYSTTSSGASEYGVCPALLNNFGYDTSMYLHTRAWYSDSKWAEILYESLDAGCPLLYSGLGRAGGHEFVCDGYRTDGYLHFNWGWGGVSDGYFALSALTPEIQGIGGNYDGFNSSQSAVTFIRPPQEGLTCPEAVLGVTGGLLFTFSGRTATVYGFIYEEDFPGHFQNISPTDGIFDFAFVISDTAGSTETIDIGGEFKVPSNYTFEWISADMPETVADGSYRLTMAYSISGTDNWKPLQTYDEDNLYAKIHVIGDDIYADGSRHTRFSEPTTALSQGQPLTVSVKASFQDSYQDAAVDRLRAALVDKNGYELASTDYTSAIMGSYRTETMQFNGGPLSEDIATGSYTMKLVDEWGDTQFTWTAAVGEGGVDKTADDSSTDTQWHDLQGRKVSRDNLAPGIYKVRAGGRTAKVRL